MGIGLALGICASLVSFSLAMLPSAFLPPPSNPDFNLCLPVAWFLGNALQGTLAALFLVLALDSLAPSVWKVPGIVAVGIAALFGVLIPCPCIVNGHYTDGLVGVYAVFVGISAMMAGILYQIARKKRQQIPPSEHRPDGNG